MSKNVTKMPEAASLRSKAQRLSSSAVRRLLEWLPVCSTWQLTKRWNIVYLFLNLFLLTTTTTEATHRQGQKAGSVEGAQRACQSAHNAAMPAARGYPLPYLVIFGLQVSESPLPSLQNNLPLCQPGRRVEEDCQGVFKHWNHSKWKRHVREQFPQPDRHCRCVTGAS